MEQVGVETSDAGVSPFTNPLNAAVIIGMPSPKDTVGLEAVTTSGTVFTVMDRDTVCAAR